MVSESVLDSYLGKHISKICTFGFTNDADNHCAHFVAHVLGYQVGATCKMMGHGSGTPASIRVQDLFANSLQVGKWNDMPVPLFAGLVFITNAGNVDLAQKTMHNVPKKHVGIFSGGMRLIWHYSNTQHKVIKQPPDQFSRHYLPPNNAMFWGSER